MSNTTETITTLAELKTRRNEIISLAATFGAHNVRVFGSVARNEATPNSDIDILVAVQPGVNMFDLVGLWLALKDLLGRDVSLITDDDHPRHQSFIDQVRTEAIAL